MARASPEELEAIRSDIADAALGLLGDLRLEEVVRAITPERLAALGPWAPSTVRYHFGGGGGPRDGRPRDYAFRRRDLGVAMVERAFEDLDAAAAEAAAEIIDAVGQDRLDREHARGLLARHVADFVPGGGGEDVQTRDRAILVAYAVCDDDAELGRLLKDRADARRSACAGMIEGVLAALHRELRPDRSLEDLAGAVLALVTSHLMACRYDAHADSAWVADAVIALGSAMTRPAPGAH